jgi:hypothetical protein
VESQKKKKDTQVEERLLGKRKGIRGQEEGG